jgi:hypothetical protein
MKNIKEVHDLIDQQDKAKSYMHEFLLWPKLWEDYLKTTSPKFTWKIFPFDNRYKNKIPNEKGIYTFIIKPNIANHCCSYLMYVGVTERQTLRKRFKQYLIERNNPKGRPKVVRLLNKYHNKNLFFCCTIFTDVDNLKIIEGRLINAFIPPYVSDLPATIRRVIRGIR